MTPGPFVVHTGQVALHLSFRSIRGVRGGQLGQIAVHRGQQAPRATKRKRKQLQIVMNVGQLGQQNPGFP